MDHDSTDQPPESPPPDRPRVGVDEWVAQVEQRTERPTGLSGLAQRVGKVLTPESSLPSRSSPLRCAAVVSTATSSTTGSSCFSTSSSASD